MIISHILPPFLIASFSSSVHAAVIAINDAIDHGVPEGTLAAMQNPNAMLVNLDASSVNDYHHTLYRAKGEKVASSRKRVSSGPGSVQRSGVAGRGEGGVLSREQPWPLGLEVIKAPEWFLMGK